MFPQPIPMQYKDPSAVLDFALDLGSNSVIGAKPWLSSGETVSSLTVTADAGITVDSSEIATNASGVASSLLVVWLSGGVVGANYNIHFTWTTSEGRTDSRVMTIRVMQR